VSKTLIVYAFEFCPNIYESAFGVISLHQTREGAEKAMEEYKNTPGWEESYQDATVISIEVLP